jgi:hypothetical protein
MSFHELLVNDPNVTHYTDKEVIKPSQAYGAHLRGIQRRFKNAPPGVECPKCPAFRSTEFYSIETKWGRLAIDVDAAWRKVQDGRPLARIHPGVLMRRVLESEIWASHLPHLPPSVHEKPGIFAYMSAPDGTVRGQLIDGNHRAVQALIDRRWFKVYVLVPSEAEQFMMWW